MRTLSLEYLSLFGVRPPELISIAATNGCRHVSLMSDTALLAGDKADAISLVDDHVLRRDTAQALRDSGVHVLIGEGLLIKADASVADYRASFDMFAELAVPRVNTLVFEQDAARARSELALLCGQAAQFGIAVSLEFTPLSSVRTLTEAATLAMELDLPNLGLTLDLLHLIRGGGTPHDVAGLDPSLIGHAQICDGALRYPGDAEYYYEAAFERLPPGHGELPIREFVAALPPDMPIGIEVRQHSLELARVSARERARRVVDATRNILCREGVAA